MLDQVVNSIKTDEQKIKFSTDLASIVLYNIQPLGRSGLYTEKKEKELWNNVKNIDTNTNLYKEIGVKPDASVKDIIKATDKKTVCSVWFSILIIAIIMNSVVPRVFYTKATIEIAILDGKLIEDRITVRDILYSDNVLDKIRSDLDLNLTTDDLRNNIKIHEGYIKNNRIIISVFGKDSKMITKIANTLGTVVINRHKDIIREKYISTTYPDYKFTRFLSKAEVSNRPIKPRLKFNVGISVVIGLIIGIYFAWLRYKTGISLETNCRRVVLYN